VWGCDSHGQLGLPQTSGTRVHNLPKQIYVPHNIRTISCGEKHLIFITHDGDVYTQGCNADGKLGIDDNSVKWSNVPVKVSLPLPSIKVHCGMSHTLCILENGDVYAWGFGEYGALGIG
jgi:regulator of chromosome condensation